MTCNIKFPALDLTGLSPDSPLWKALLEYGGYAAEGYQTGFQEFQDRLKAGLIEPGKRMDEAAKAFADNYRDMADRGNKWLNDLPAKGPIAEAYRDRIAAEYLSQAAILSNDAISATDRFKQLTTEVNSRLANVPGGEAVAGRIGFAFDGMQLADAFIRGDGADFYGNLAQMLGAEIGGIVGAAAVVAIVGATAPGWAVVSAAALGAVGAAWLGKHIGPDWKYTDTGGVYDRVGAWIAPYAEAFGRTVGDLAEDAASFLCGYINTQVTAALNWVPPGRDPLVLDLDGNGITTSGINAAAPIYFDQDADGVKAATGWIASGEAIVVRDLNGNGLIDSGRELFGDNTILTRGARAGQLAANGFEALADLDSDINGVADGKFDAADIAFASVKLWKDANQNGISETAELFTFAQLGVASINVTGTASNVNLGGGNTQTVTGSFTRTAGTVGEAGTAHLAGSLLLANNNFYRQFTDDPVLTTAAKALPQMRGSGAVRDLRPALSLGAAQAASLQTALGQPLSPGMTVTAEIKTGKRRVIEFLLSPVQRVESESLRARR